MLIFEALFFYVLWKHGIAAALLLYISCYAVVILGAGIFFLVISGALNNIDWKLPVAGVGALLFLGTGVYNHHKEKLRQGRLTFLQDVARLPKYEQPKAIEYKRYL